MNTSMILEYEYDEENRKIKMVYLLNGIEVFYSIYEYDKSIIVKSTSYDNNNKQTSYSIYDYDKDNCLIKIVNYSVDDTLKNYVIIEYGYIK